MDDTTSPVGKRKLRQSRKRWRRLNYLDGLFSDEKIKALVGRFGPLPIEPLSFETVYGQAPYEILYHREAKFGREFGLKIRLNLAADHFMLCERGRKISAANPCREEIETMQKIERKALELLGLLNYPSSGPISSLYLKIACLSGLAAGNDIISVRRIAARARRKQLDLLIEENQRKHQDERLQEILRRDADPPRNSYWPRKEFIEEVVDIWIRIFGRKATVSHNKDTQPNGSEFMQFAGHVLKIVPNMQLAGGEALVKILRPAVRAHPAWLIARKKDCEFYLTGHIERTESAGEQEKSARND